VLFTKVQVLITLFSAAEFLSCGDVRIVAYMKHAQHLKYEVFSASSNVLTRQTQLTLVRVCIAIVNVELYVQSLVQYCLA
jgi:hypothetical protein